MSTAVSLASTHWVSGWPQLAAEWHPTHNAGLEPNEVSHGSGRKVWWKCPRGADHEWRASPNNRTAGGTGCPFCAGRKVSVTNSLAALRPDLVKQWHPTRNGALVPEQIVAGSTRRVWWVCPAALDHAWRASPHDRWSVEGGCPYCHSYRVCRTNSLAAMRPRLAAEWHPTKNPGLTARDVVPGTGRRVWWRCAKNKDHEWRASVSNRTFRRSGCPFCAGKRASAEHCLAAAHPAIAREWHPTRNGALTPASMTPRTRRTAWWLCAAGHEWRMSIGTRTRRGSPCPVCSGKGSARPGASPVASDSRDAGPTRMARDLCEEHRRIEQTVVLLGAEPTVDDAALFRLAADITAHSEAEVSVFYPAAEKALSRTLAAQRALHARLRRVLSQTSGDRVFRGDRLRELRAVFAEHARFEEGVALPALETVMERRALDALWRRVKAARATILVRFGETSDGGVA
jgi:hypothetical protein